MKSPRYWIPGRVSALLAAIILAPLLAGACGDDDAAPEPVSVVAVRFPTAGSAPLVVHFDATETSGPISEYVWEFGDGTSDTGVSPIHVYDTPGSYDARLIVLEEDGGADSVTVPVTVTAPVSPSPLPGQVVVDPSDPAWLSRGSQPLFLCGPGDPENFLYRGTRNSDGTRSGDQASLIDKLAPTGANTVYLMASRAPGGDGDPTENPFLGSNPERPFAAAILDQWDTWFEALNAAGIVIFFFFYDDESTIDHPSWDTGDVVGLRERAYLEGLVNRFEHLENLIWVIKEEADEKFTPNRLSNIAAVIREADDHDHVVATHLLSSIDFGALGDDPNIDQFAIQWFPSTPDSVHAAMSEAWDDAAGRYNNILAEMPLPSTLERDIVRRTNWAAALGGAYSMVYEWDIANTPVEQLEDCGRLVTFFEGVELTGMAPNDGLAAGGTDWVLAEPGDEYVAFAVDATETLGLGDLTAGMYDLRWFDPRDGTTVTQSDVRVSEGTSAWPIPPGIGSEVALHAVRGSPSAQTPEITPLWPTFGWPAASPAEMGMDEAKLIEARDYAIGTNGGRGSGFVTRHGRVVMTWGDVDRQWEVKSITKSFGATLLGLAIKDGLMSLGDPAQLHHPSLGVPPDSNTTTGWLDDIQMLNLATHTAGFEEAAGYGALVYEPGTAFLYSDGGANWLAETVTLGFEQDVRTVLHDRILSPLGVSFGDLSWRDNAYRDTEIEGIPNHEFGSGISTNVDVLARLGYLYLREGVWDGTQILPEDYVATATGLIPEMQGLTSLHETYPDAPGHYGLHWWNNADGSMPTVPTDTYFAWGLNEGLIVVIPSLDIVATRLGNPWRTSGQDPHYPAVEPFIQSIVESVLNP